MSTGLEKEATTDKIKAWAMNHPKAAFIIYLIFCIRIEKFFIKELLEVAGGLRGVRHNSIVWIPIFCLVILTCQLINAAPMIWYQWKKSPEKSKLVIAFVSMCETIGWVIFAFFISKILGVLLLVIATIYH